MEHKLPQLKSKGFVVLPNVFCSEEVSFARALVLNNRQLFKNTRPSKSSGHLAGFHHYPQLANLHAMLCDNAKIKDELRKATDYGELLSIGLTDITINRSQEWHVDLLRGEFASYLSDEICWGDAGGGVYKVLLYLQSATSLWIRPGSHLIKISLLDDSYAVPRAEESIEGVAVEAGDVVLMDIRLVHRGSSEQDIQLLERSSSPKILISSVFGGEQFPLTHAMKAGNAVRLNRWIDKYR